jgi:hypothetical protein
MWAWWRHVGLVAPCGLGGAMWAWWRHVGLVAPCGLGGAMWAWWRHVGLVAPCGLGGAICYLKAKLQSFLWTLHSVHKDWWRRVRREETGTQAAAVARAIKATGSGGGVCGGPYRQYSDTSDASSSNADGEVQVDEVCQSIRTVLRMVQAFATE